MAEPQYHWQARDKQRIPFSGMAVEERVRSYDQPSDATIILALIGILLFLGAWL